MSDSNFNEQRQLKQSNNFDRQFDYQNLNHQWSQTKQQYIDQANDQDIIYPIIQELQIKVQNLQNKLNPQNKYLKSKYKIQCFFLNSKLHNYNGIDYEQYSNAQMLQAGFISDQSQNNQLISLYDSSNAQLSDSQKDSQKKIKIESTNIKQFVPFQNYQQIKFDDLNQDKVSSDQSDQDYAYLQEYLQLDRDQIISKADMNKFFSIFSTFNQEEYSLAYDRQKKLNLREKFYQQYRPNLTKEQAVQKLIQLRAISRVFIEKGCGMEALRISHSKQINISIVRYKSAMLYFTRAVVRMIQSFIHQRFGQSIRNLNYKLLKKYANHDLCHVKTKFTQTQSHTYLCLMKSSVKRSQIVDLYNAIRRRVYDKIKMEQQKVAIIPKAQPLLKLQYFFQDPCITPFIKFPQISQIQKIYDYRIPLKLGSQPSWHIQFQLAIISLIFKHRYFGLIRQQLNNHYQCSNYQKDFSLQGFDCKILRLITKAFNYMVEEFKFYLEEERINKITFGQRKMIFLNRFQRRLLFHREDSIHFKLMVFDYYRHTVASNKQIKIKYKDYRFKYISYTFQVGLEILQRNQHLNNVLAQPVEDRYKQYTILNFVKNSINSAFESQQTQKNSSNCEIYKKPVKNSKRSVFEQLKQKLEKQIRSKGKIIGIDDSSLDQIQSSNSIEQNKLFARNQNGKTYQVRKFIDYPCQFSQEQLRRIVKPNEGSIIQKNEHKFQNYGQNIKKLKFQDFIDINQKKRLGKPKPKSKNSRPQINQQKVINEHNQQRFDKDVQMLNMIRRRKNTIKHGKKKKTIYDRQYFNPLGKPLTGIYINYGQNALTLQDIQKDEQQWKRRKLLQKNKRRKKVHKNK